MAANTKWGRAGWGRNPSALRRQMPPSFMHRHDVANAIVANESRFASHNAHDALAYEMSETQDEGNTSITFRQELADGVE